MTSPTPTVKLNVRRKTTVSIDAKVKTEGDTTISAVSTAKGIKLAVRNDPAGRYYEDIIIVSADNFDALVAVFDAVREARAQEQEASA